MISNAEVILFLTLDEYLKPY